MQQQTEEWFTARLGKVTASMVSSVLMKPTTKGYQDYQAQLIVERLTGQPSAHFVSPDMEWGTLCEPQARAAYELESGNEVSEVGFVQHALFEMSGASPDGVIGSLGGKAFGLVEIKCPRSAKHIHNLVSGIPDRQYLNQMQWQMACTGADWCDFVSFDPRLPVECQISIARVSRDAEQIAEMERAVGEFLEETQALQDKLTARMKEAA